MDEHGTDPLADEDVVRVLDADGRPLPDATVPDLSDDRLRAIYRDLVVTRRFDERAVSLQRQGRIGTYAPCAGQEGSAVGSTHALADVSFSVTERKAEGEPVALEWHSDVPLRTVVLKYGTVFENFYVDDATSGTVTVGAGDVRLVYEPKDSPALSNGQEPSDPCPDGETGIKYEYEGGEFSRDS